MAGLKLFFVVNVDDFFLSHRLPLGLEAVRRGYQVTVVAIDTGRRREIEQHGIRFIDLPATRSGTNPWQELIVLWFLYRLYRREKPHIVHHIAIKAVAYGAIAARFAQVPRVVNAISGLGFVFINADAQRTLYTLLRFLFKIGLNNPNVSVIFQNPDDLAFFRDLNILKPYQMVCIKGSGVDLSEFALSEFPPEPPVRVVLPARMLRDKGVVEFVEAARLLKPDYGSRVEFLLAGGIDPGNKSGISEQELQHWTGEGAVQWIGFQRDMASIFRTAHIVALPSYREGLSKALIEACAIGRAIVTTDVPGCRDVVETEKNGLLVPARDARQLAAALARLIDRPDQRRDMGLKARQKAEQEFSIDHVITQTFHLYESEPCLQSAQNPI